MLKYYEINEETAKFANDANSFKDYKVGTATKTYRNYVDRVYTTVEKIENTKEQHIVTKQLRK